MRKTTKTLMSVTAASLALTLSACGGGSAPKASESATPEAANPVLSVPETTEDKAIGFKLNPGNAPAGQKYHIGVYTAGAGKNPTDCSEEISSTDGQFGDGETSGAVQVKKPGKYQLVLSTEGHASACDDPNGATTVKTKPQVFLDGNINADGEQTLTTSPGKRFDVAVVLKGDFPKDTKQPVRLTVHGPYSTEPELRAAGCGDDKVAASQTVDWTGRDLNRANNRYTSVPMTIEGTKGLYLVTAENEETAEAASATTECGNYQSVLKVSTKGVKQEIPNDNPTSTGGTNGLTDKQKKGK